MDIPQVFFKKKNQKFYKYHYYHWFNDDRYFLNDLAASGNIISAMHTQSGYHLMSASTHHHCTFIISSVHLDTMSTFICCPNVESKTSVRMQAPASPAAMVVLTFNGTQHFLTVIEFPLSAATFTMLHPLFLFFFCCRLS